MTAHAQYTLSLASAAEFTRLWFARVDDLEWHLSSHTWVRLAIAVVFIAYPSVRFVIPAVLKVAVPDVVRTVIHLI